MGGLVIFCRMRNTEVSADFSSEDERGSCSLERWVMVAEVEEGRSGGREGGRRQSFLSVCLRPSVLRK